MCFRFDVLKMWKDKDDIAFVFCDMIAAGCVYTCHLIVQRAESVGELGSAPWTLHGLALSVKCTDKC